MNKKLIYVFVVLVAGLFLISSCEQTVGIQTNQLDRGDRGIINAIPKRNTVLLSLESGERYNGLTLNEVYEGVDQNRNYVYCDVTYNRRRENINEGEVKSVSVPGENTVYVAVLTATTGDINNGICRLILVK